MQRVELGSGGVLATGRWLKVRALAWMMALTIITVVLYNATTRGVVLVFAEEGTGPTDGLRLAAAVAGVLAILLFYGMAVRWGERRAPGELSWRGAGRDIALGMALGAALIALVVAVQWAAGWVTVTPRPVESAVLALRDALRSGVLEELVLRLIVLRLLWRIFGAWPAIAGSALLFGALHMANPDASLFAAACLIAGEGVAIGLYLITGRIWASMAWHASWNFTQGWLLGAAVSGTEDFAGGPLATSPIPGVNPLFNGGGFGPEASLPALGVSLVASIATLRWAWKRGAMAGETRDERLDDAGGR